MGQPLNILLCRLVLGGLLLESQKLEEKRMVVARLDFWREEFCGRGAKFPWVGFGGGAEGDETLHRLSHCDLSRWCGAEEGGGGGAVVGGVFRGNLIAGCVEALFSLDLPSSLPFFSFLECCCWFVYNTAAISSDADNLCWRAFGWKGKQPCIVYAAALFYQFLSWWWSTHLVEGVDNVEVAPCSNCHASVAGVRCPTANESLLRY